MTLFQKYFLLDQSVTAPSNLWTIPISIATANDEDFEDTTASYWLKTAKETTDIDIGDEDWVILNKQATGKFMSFLSRQRINTSTAYKHLFLLSIYIMKSNMSCM